MFCLKCGARIPEGSRFCPGCGYNVQQNPQPAQPQQNRQPSLQPQQNQTYQQPQQNQSYQQTQQRQTYQQYQQAQQTQQYGQYQQSRQYSQNQPYGQHQPYYNPVQAQTPMKWYKFLIYFLLFANAVIYLFQAIGFFSGSQYGDEYLARSVYAQIPSMKVVDVLTGLLYLAAAGFSVYTRFMLSGYKKTAPTCVYIYYILNVVIQIFYLMLTYFVLSGISSQIASALVSETIPTAIGSVVGCVLGVVLNHTYFTKRAHMFVN